MSGQVDKKTVIKDLLEQGKQKGKPFKPRNP